MQRKLLTLKVPKPVVIILLVVFFVFTAVILLSFFDRNECGAALQRWFYKWHKNYGKTVLVFFALLAGGWVFFGKARRIYKIIFFCLLILFLLVAGTFDSARLKSRDARRIVDIKQLQIALEQYKDANRTYPDKLDNIKQQGLMPEIPVDPVTQEPYPYRNSGNSYVLSAKLEHCSNSILGDDLDPSNDMYDVGP